MNTDTKKPRYWGRWILFSIVGLVLLVVVAGIGFSLWLNSYLHGEKFRTLVGEKTSKFLCADGRYMPLHWTGTSVYSDGYEARGLPGCVFTDLRADQIRAEFQPQGIFHHAWRINELNIQRFHLELGRKDAPRRDARPSGSDVESEHPSSWAPNRLELVRMQIQDVNLSWSNGLLKQMRAVLEQEGAAWVGRGFGGEIRQSGWPALEVDHVRARFQGAALFVTESLLKIRESETVNVSGQVDFERGAVLDLLVKLTGVSVTPYLPMDWRARLHGNVSGETRVTGRWDGVQVEGQLNLSHGVLEALPVLDQIALFTQTAQFRRLTLQKASADFVWTERKLTVKKLVMGSEGLMRVEGGFVKEEGQVDGVFQVGVAPSTLRWLPGSQKRVFTVDRDGYAWTDVKVSGPVGNLKEDLSRRLMVAAGTEVIEGAKGAVEKGMETVIDVLKPLLP